MKLLKKLTAVVAMAAVCLAMITPVRSSAALALLECPPHNYVKGDFVERIEMWSMDHIMDEYDETGSHFCTVVEYRYIYDAECISCEVGLAAQIEETVWVHLHEKCDYYDEDLL